MVKDPFYFSSGKIFYMFLKKLNAQYCFFFPLFGMAQHIKVDIYLPFKVGVINSF